MKARLMAAAGLIAAALMPALGHAQSPPIYKWIDANGVVNYASKAPPGATAQRLHLGSLSTNVVKAEPVAPPAGTRERELNREVDRLERELDGERQQRAQLERQMQAESRMGYQVYDECVRQRRVDCDRPWTLEGHAPVVGYPAYVYHRLATAHRNLSR